MFNMAIFNKRILSLIYKELLALFRDPRSRTVLIAPPLMQLIIFTFAATLEIKNIDLVIFNQDMGKHGQKIVQRITASPVFKDINFVNNKHEYKTYIEEQNALASVNIPSDFSKDIDAGKTPNLQLIFDGRESNAAQVLTSYLTEIISAYFYEINAIANKPKLPLEVQTRNWFNENLIYMWFTVPSLVTTLALTITIIITSLSIAREKELGTFDQILVSPLMPHEILIGKTVPGLIVGLCESLLIWATSIILFGVPFEGSFFLLVFMLFAFVMSVVGVGLFISAISKTQQQAVLGSFFFMVPAITLSGYSAPVDNMPMWLQKIVWFNPLMHALICVKGLFLKNMSFVDLWHNIWPLLMVGVVTLSFAAIFFNRKLN
jgi:ABC-2 type transport system permease protein